MRSFSLSVILLMLAVFAAASPIMDQDKRDSSTVVVSSPLFKSLPESLSFPADKDYKRDSSAVVVPSPLF
jgi:hypothetical protein